MPLINVIYLHSVVKMNERKTNQSRQFGKPAWDWTPVQCVLKTTESNRKSVQWQLAPSILLTNPTSTNSDPNVRLFIDTEKSLSYATDLGWNWHKSWNLPNISIRLEIKDQATGEQLLTPKNIFAQIFAVKKNGDNQRSEKVVLLDVGIRGDSKMQMVDGQVYFSAMKFSSTTYNNEGQNFHLLIVIYIQQNQADKPKVLTAVISPQIFVDSRRSARDYQEKKFNSFVQPFSTDQLDKQFIKRQNKSRTEQEIEIKNDPEGFYNYLTAPNIRHKVKHPIFLAIRFSNCVTILYNQQKLTQLINSQKQNETNSAITAREIMQILQKKLLKQSQTKKQDGAVSSIPQKLFLFIVENISDSLKRKKVMESIETLESQSFGVVEDVRQIPTEFKRLTQFGSLSKIYKDSFEMLKDLCRRYVPSDEESSGEESDEEYGERSEEVKKVKVNKIENGNEFTFNNPKKPKPANIVCQTIQTVDSKIAPLSNTKNLQEEIKNEKHLVLEANSSNRLEKEKEIKEEDDYHKEITYKPVPDNSSVGFRPITANPIQTTPVANNVLPTQPNSFSINIGSKKGSAFNNLRAPEPDKNQILAQQQQQQQQQPFNLNSNLGFSGYPGNSNNSFGLNNLGALGGLNSMGGVFNMGGLGQSGLGGIPGLTNMNGLNPIAGISGLTGMTGLNGLSGLQGLNTITGMAGLPMNNLGMPGIGNLGGLNSGVGQMPGLGNLGGYGLTGFQNNAANLTRNNTGFGNFSQNVPNNMNNLNNQAKSLQNLLCSNLLLSNWLSSVKANNQSLEQSMKGSKSSDEESQKQKNPQDPLSDLSRFSPQENQSMAYLLQQINLYRELLNQVTYQNQLLGRNMNTGQGMAPANNVNQLQEMIQSIQSGNNQRFRGFQAPKQNDNKEPKEEHQQ